MGDPGWIIRSMQAWPSVIAAGIFQHRMLTLPSVGKGSVTGTMPYLKTTDWKSIHTRLPISNLWQFGKKDNNVGNLD